MLKTYFLPLTVLAALPGSYAATDCPDGSSPGLLEDTSICCPGTLADLPDFQGCIIGCETTNPPCFPFCSDGQASPSTSGECTSVPMTASDYTQRVYGGSTTATATPTSGMSSTTTTTAPSTDKGTNGTNNTDDGGSGAATNTPAPTTDEPGAAPRITQAPVLALAGGLIGLALL